MGALSNIKIDKNTITPVTGVEQISKAVIDRVVYINKSAIKVKASITHKINGVDAGIEVFDDPDFNIPAVTRIDLNDIEEDDTDVTVTTSAGDVTLPVNEWAGIILNLIAGYVKDNA